MNLEVTVAYYAVRREVFAFEMHVDRHVIFGAASTNWRDEVDSDDPASLLDERFCFWCEKEFHLAY